MQPFVRFVRNGEGSGVCSTQSQSILSEEFSYWPIPTHLTPKSKRSVHVLVHASENAEKASKTFVLRGFSFLSHATRREDGYPFK